jgi:protein ImuA
MRVMAAQGLSALRREIAAIEGTRAALDDGRPVLPLGVPAIDAALGGGLARGAVHALGPAAPVHRGAAFGFALALAGRASQHAQGHVLWIETPFAAAETGRPYLGLASFGLALARVLVVRVPRPIDVLWVMEEALTCRGIAAAIAELTQDVDLTASRRLALAARDGGGLGLLVHHRDSVLPNAAMTRWRIAAAPSRRDAFGGLGHAAFDLILTKNRHGPCGRWTILWDHHERAFQALSVGVASASRDRPARLLRTA